MLVLVSGAGAGLWCWIGIDKGTPRNPPERSLRCFSGAGNTYTPELPKTAQNA